MSRQCRICKWWEFDMVIDFGFPPLVNSLLDEKDLEKPDQKYSLIVERCTNCGLVQIVDPVESHKIYQDQDYLYFTGDMPQNSDYMKAFDGLVDELMKQSNLDDLVVEIGSNDGTVLERFVGRRTLGVDPATNVVTRALAKAIPTLCAEFNKQVASNIKKEFGPAKIVGGANCLAHIHDIHSVLEGVEELLDDDGVFWVECNYWGGMVKAKHYALIYHDHYSYFTLQNWIDLLAMHKMMIFDAYITEAQGEGLSLRLYAKKQVTEQTERFKELEKREKVEQPNSQEICDKYRDDVTLEAKKLNNLLFELKQKGARIAGYGAAAKGFAILHLAQINSEVIDYFVDDSEVKQGKYTPITRIPVISRKEAESKLPDFFFITAPNYAKIIIEKEKALGYKGNFILADATIIYGNKQE